MPVVIGVIVAMVFVAAIAVWVFAVRGAARGAAAGSGSGEEFARPRPPVTEFHVRGEEARVYFDVPLGTGGADEVLANLLVHEAVEVVREKRHTLPIGDAEMVVAFARGGDGFERVGQFKLATPGELPPPVAPPPPAYAAGPDPLAASFDAVSPQAPGTVEAPRRELLGPVGPEVAVPATLEAGLRAQGIEPSAASAGELVVGTLRMSGYQLSPADREGTFFATRAGMRTYITVDEFKPGDYPELAEALINQFMVAFASSGADRGILVSDRFGPFLCYEKERREPRVRFVTRERIQHFIDSLAVG